MITIEDRRARACAELRRGSPIVLRNDQHAAIVISTETLTQSILNASLKLSTEAPVLTISARRAATLNAHAYDGDLARLELSSYDDAAFIRAIADPATDLKKPLKGPLKALREGDAKLARASIALCKRAKLLPSTLAFPLGQSVDPVAFAQQHDLALMDEIGARGPEAGRWVEVVEARVPIALAPNSRLRIFRRSGWDDEHYAIEIGEPPRHKPVLARLHSACATGDIFGSMKCDCGPQLHQALKRIAEEGGGVLVYLMQEGRGIGLANKMRAYRLQDEGFDTVEANHRLGFDDDERLLTDGGQILREMGFHEVRLMTNNPKKIKALEDAGLKVSERSALITQTNPENENYLKVKAAKSGHLF